MTDEVLFENLEYGAYYLDYPGDGVFHENVKFTTAEFNKLHARRVRLPDGKGNVIYLMSDTFDHTLTMLRSDNFIIPPTYKRIFYPLWSMGTFMGRRYKLNIGNKAERTKLIKSRTRFKEYSSRVLQKSLENVFFGCCDIYTTISPIVEKMKSKKLWEGFYPELMRILGGLTPEPAEEGKNGEWNNRLMIFDAEAFGFRSGASLKDNQTNPLYILYLAYLRSRNLEKLGVDCDMMICSKNMFLKFNPAKLDEKNWTNFKRALFRIINANLDDYTAQLSDEDKAIIDETSKDRIVSNIVKNTVDPYTQMVSPSTKAVLADAVERKFRQKVKEVSDLDTAIKDTQKNVAEEIGVEPPKPEVGPGITKDHEDLFVQSLQQDKIPSLIHTNPAKTPLDYRRQTLFNAIGSQYQPLGVRTGQTVEDDEEDDYPPEDLEDVEDEVQGDVNEILTTDEEVASEVLDEIQDHTAPLNNPKTAPINSARDKKLREEQKKVVVKSETIEQVLARDGSNVPIKSENKGAVMHTSNKNMQNMTFVNFDKTYIDELYVKDLVACFDMLKDKDSPFYITGIDIKDTSNSMNLQETWTVHLVDENKKRHTIKVDIPKFQNDRFMLINGTKWIILKQNFYNPLVKDTPDTVILTTNFNKVTIKRKATKSLTSIERIFSLIKKSGDAKMFVTGDSTRGNLKYISSLEYDELARRLFKFSSDTCELYFSRDYIRDNLSDKIPTDIKGDEFYIGTEGKHPVFINEDTGLDRMGRTIVEIIEANLPDNYKTIFNSIKGPTQSMYVEGKLAGEFIPVIATLIVWVGLTKTLDAMKIQWKFDPDAKKVPTGNSSRKYIRFADGLLEYEAKTFAELILNGLMKLHPERMQFKDFDSEIGYEEFIYSQWGSYKGITELKNFYEFILDPITKDVCRDLMLPTTPEGLLIHAVKLLCDNAFVSKASDQSYRVRSIEMIPAILYSCIANQYKSYVNSGRRLPMTLNQRCVISRLIAEKTVEAYSTLNPVIEVSKTHTISTKGYRGSNSEHSYDEEKRSYDPSSVGKIAISTSADANVGINKNLVIEPTLSNARGYRDQVDDPSQLKDVNIFSPVEMLTPGTARNDDPIRTAIAGKQSQHIVPVADAAPALVSNGYDEAVQFHLSDDFVINAEEDGKVVDVNEEVGFVVVQYKSGKTRAINTKPEVVKNSGGGFFMSNQLVPTHVKVGETFKKDEPLAYHPNYFRYSKLNGLRFSIGPLAKMALMSSYNTYEDAGICTQKLAERMRTAIVYKEDGKFKKNNNILSIVKIGDHVNIGDPLIRFDVSVEENELAKYLSKLSEENANLLEEETKNEIKASHAGKVIDIKVYTLLDPSALSPSLGKVVQQYFDQGNNKKKFLEKYDSSDGIVKAGYMLTDSTEPIQSRYNSIKGIKGIDVLIEIYIEHQDVMKVGDKVALYGPNKQIISEVIPEGYEPYSEFRPDEEISVMTSPGTIARRMTPSIIPVSAANKVLIELKRKIAAEIKYG